ncbi:MAG: DUF3857 domain-containing protein [bacterium]|nr:DUF3857 domain-containing protein [bacterium]
MLKSRNYIIVFICCILLLPAAGFAAGDKDYPVEILLEEGKFFYNKKGIRRYIFKRKYRVLTQKGVNEWNYVNASWHSWYQKKPEIKVKVTSPKGTVRYLDPKTLGEVAARQKSRLIYTDTRTIRGPMPAIEIGSIVEETYIQQDTIAFFKAGSRQWYTIGRNIPIKHAKLYIDLPSSVPFKYKLYNLNSKPEVKRKNGRVSYSFDKRNVPGMEYPPLYRPPGSSHWPSVEFSTVPDWNKVARIYNSIVKQQLKDDSRVNSLVSGAARGKSKNIELIKKLVKRMHGEVRYTGLEFGDASIIPRSPNKVLERRYGDCKEKSALLVAMLRKVGIKAHIVLLNAGFGSDVSKDMPGIEFFNHAIVYVPAPYRLWIDPTAEFTAVGELPLPDQERYALIIDPKTRSLVRTPGRRSRQNRVTLTRDVFLSQLGKSSIKETMEATGPFASSLRSYYDEQGHKNINKIFSNYVEKKLYSQNYKNFRYTDPYDFSKIFSYTLTATGSRIGYTSVEDAEIELPIGFIITKFPNHLMNFSGYDGENESDDSYWKKRKTDLLLPVPHTSELIYNIHIPPGFESVNLPDNETVRIGDSVIRKSFNKKGSLIVAAFKMDTGRGRYTPDQLKKLRKELYRIGSNSMITLKFVSSGFRLVEQGKVGESVKFYKKLIARYPKEQGNYIRLGNILLAAGFKDSSVYYLRKAIELDKKSIEAYMALGWAYLHDPFGRQFTGSIEREKAMKVYAEVTRLDPGIGNAWRNLAVLSEYDSDGNRFSPNSDIKKAVVYYEKYRKKLKRHDLDYNYIRALYRIGAYSSILKLKKQTFATNESWAIYLAALTIKQGLPPLWTSLDSISSNKENREKILEMTAYNLASIRYYKQSSEILLRLSKFSRNTIEFQSRAGFLANLKRWEEVPVHENKPEEVVFKLMKLIYLDEINKKNLGQVYSKTVLVENNLERLEKRYKKIRKNFVRRTSKEGRLHTAVFDALYTNMKFKVSGNDSLGYRVVVTTDLMKKKVYSIYYIVKEKEGFRLIDDSSENFPSRVGFLALSHCGKGNYALASEVLDWMLEYKKDGFRSGLEGHPFFHVWERSTKEKEKIKLASFLLLARYPEFGNKLVKARENFSGKKDLLQIDRALLVHYLAGDNYPESLAVLERILKPGETSPLMLETYLHLLGKTNKNMDTLAASCRKLLKENPDKIEYIYLYSMITIEDGKLKEAEQILEDAHRKNLGNAQTYNLMAWLGLFTGKSPEKLLDLSVKSNRLSDFSAHSMLHTLATIYAEQGKVSEAKQVVSRMLANRGESTITESDHYIFGRNAETLGLPVVARQHYAKIKPDKDTKQLTVYELAARRLKLLK